MYIYIYILNYFFISRVFSYILVRGEYKNFIVNEHPRNKTREQVATAKNLN